VPPGFGSGLTGPGVGLTGSGVGFTGSSFLQEEKVIRPMPKQAIMRTLPQFLIDLFIMISF
jgi:hypothetical protein